MIFDIIFNSFCYFFSNVLLLYFNNFCVECVVCTFNNFFVKLYEKLVFYFIPFQFNLNVKQDIEKRTKKD